ncbi:MAG: ABC transporter permease, partial [Alphaproteobacteria bacterium]|nr:ABC transporter permease [Alphaproteobacteria bacterium]
MKSDPAAFHRKKETPKGVLLADRAADWVIRLGGLGVIVAVFGILVFLIQAVLPLFAGGKVGAPMVVESAAPGPVLHRRIDEYRTLALTLTAAGEVIPVHVATGRALAVQGFDLGGKAPTAFAATLEGEHLVFGFADGTLRFADLLPRATTLRGEDLPADLAPLGADRTDGRAVYTALGEDQYRRLAVELREEPPLRLAADAGAIIALDYRVGGTAERRTRAFATVDDRGIARASLAEAKLNILTRRVRLETRTATLPPLPAGFAPLGVLVTERADQVVIAAADGRALRYDLRDFSKPVLAETARLAPEGVGVTAIRYLIGEQSVVVGRSDGGVGVFALVEGSAGGHALVEIHRLAPQGGPVIAIEASRRAKSFATLDAGGGLWLRHATSEQVLARLAAPGASAIALAPRDDGLLAAHEGGHRFWTLDFPHPETTPGTILGKVWYEGYPAPSHTWQSSSGNDSFEPKLSLVPLIFGTL